MPAEFTYPTQERRQRISLLRELLEKNAPPFTATDKLSATDQQIVVPDFAWFIPERLAALAYPQSTDTFLAIREMGVSVLLNLSEAPLPASALNYGGLIAEHIPIVGFTAPGVRQIKQALATIDVCLEHAIPVGIVGIRHASVILACFLIERSMEAQAAIDSIRQWRPGSLEYTLQQTAVFRYAAALT